MHLRFSLFGVGLWPYMPGEPSCCFGDAGPVCGFPALGSGCTDITDFLSVGTRISYRWVPRNRVGAFILRSEDRTTNGLWPGSRVN